jgi:hypothetical protein
MNDSTELVIDDTDALWLRIRADLLHTRIGYPHDAAALLRTHRERLMPKLLAEFEIIVADPLAEVSGDNYILHFHLIAFLAEFRETRAYPMLVAATRLGEEDAESIFGDFLTEVMARALASVCDGNIELLEALANDATCGCWCRNAGVMAITTRALEGDLSAQDAAHAIERIGLAEARRQRALPPEQQDNTFLSCVVGDLGDLRAVPALPNIRDWFQDQLVDPTFQGTYEKVERDILRDDFAVEQARALQYDKGYVRDATKELANWAMFEAPREDTYDDVNFPFWQADGLPYERTLPKTGRNDPCPCSSGKKFKKCCGD